MKHQTCSDKVLDLQCFGHCGYIYLNIRAYQTGFHYIKFILNNIEWDIKVAAEQGQFFRFKNSLPEYSDIIFTLIQPDRTLLKYKHVNINTASICDYSMFSIKTRQKFIIEDDAINIYDLMCLNECPKFDDINLLCK